MKTNKKTTPTIKATSSADQKDIKNSDPKNRDKKNRGKDFAERLWAEGWTYIKTVVDTLSEPFLVLDKDLRVMAANESFYRTFKVKEKDTENKIIYDLGNGQWNIPDLKKLLENVLPDNTFFKGFQVEHDFPKIGRKIVILNARRVYKENNANDKFPPVILLAIEDVTELMIVAENLAGQNSQLEDKITEQTNRLETYIEKLQKEISKLKSKK